MTIFVADCPRCGAQKITFDVTGHHCVRIEHDWQKWYEVLSQCRSCASGTIFVVSEKGISESRAIKAMGGLLKITGGIDRLVNIVDHINIKDVASIDPPEHLPAKIKNVFTEGATCLAVGCHNAAGAMFRLCIDLATKERLPKEDVNGLNSKIRFSLGLRLPWLFDQSFLPKELKDLSTCIKEDGNDGAHDGTLTRTDAEDILDFTGALLERLYTEPERLRLAEERRKTRRGESAKKSPPD